MSVLSHIGRSAEKELITAIVAAGLGKSLIEKFCEAPGVLSISHHHARGVGTRRVKAGQLYSQERDVLLILVERTHLDTVFDSVFKEAGIKEPGGGIMFSETVLRGHPMMPFEGADW